MSDVLSSNYQTLRESLDGDKLVLEQSPEHAENFDQTVKVSNLKA